MWTEKQQASRTVSFKNGHSVSGERTNGEITVRVWWGRWGVQTHAHKQGSDHLVPLAAVPSELHPVDRDTAA